MTLLKEFSGHYLKYLQKVTRSKGPVSCGVLDMEVISS